MHKALVLVSTLVIFIPSSHHANADYVVDFEEMTQFTGDSPNGGGQFYNGNDGSGTTNDNGWTSGGVFFNNSYNGDNLPAFDFWSGWSYSNVVNICFHYPRFRSYHNTSIFNGKFAARERFQKRICNAPICLSRCFRPMSLPCIPSPRPPSPSPRWSGPPWGPCSTRWEDSLCPSSSAGCCVW